MEPTHIDVKGARVHNLRNVSIKLPRNALVCFTGVSGSGKSSLAFDTLFAEGQRRYIESLSSYARQFLGQVEKPDCDLISGLSPSIAIQQKSAGQNPRSTVGTITAIHDFLRVLYARIGLQHCTKCGRPISAQTREQITAAILSGFAGRRMLVLAPVARGQKGEFRDLFADLLRAGFVRVRVDGQMMELRGDASLEKNKRHDIEVVIDRLVVSDADRARLAEAVENGLRVGKGTLLVTEEDTQAPATAGRLGHESTKGSDEATKGARTPRNPPKGKQSEISNLKSAILSEQLFSSHYACTHCGLSYEPPSPQLFSFNSPTGMCMRCDGLGETFDFDPALIIPDDRLHFLSPCIAPMRHSPGRWRRHIYEGVARHLGINLRTPWRDLPEHARHALLHGTGGAHIEYVWRWSGGEWRHGDKFAGVVEELRDKYRKARSGVVRGWYEKFMQRGPCPDCGASRLNDQARNVRISAPGWAIANHGQAKTLDRVSGRARLSPSRLAGRLALPNRDPNQSRDRKGADQPRDLEPAPRDFGPALHELCALPVSRVLEVINSLSLTPVQQQIAAEVLKEVRSRLQFLLNVGLHYLTLDRTAPTLSGGEAQRIRLAGQIGSGLTGVLYVLDEPSIGLHPRDNRRLLESLITLRDMGNTVIVVEHDEETMRTADHLVDFGPGPGVRGGKIVAQGTPDEVTRSPESLTGQYLRGERTIEIPKQRRPVTRPSGTATPRSQNATPSDIPKRKQAKQAGDSQNAKRQRVQ